ncbi:transcriptional regulator [Nocardia sp. CC227C]|uniref:transcriptional regulator n=1 Tax=Nocardia sp. CC227C TaxID=3044562 RepID=UPI00278C5CA1|nr:transcriptional regulator [Nocardia sp. CC227C]
MSAPHRRPALIILVVVTAAACLGLGYWQWTRFESGNGTAQNLGYALQWPLFAGFALWAYFRFVRLERDAEAEADAADRAEPTAPNEPTDERGGVRGVLASWRAGKSGPREIPAGLLPERPTAARDEDPVLAEYNQYLADLHARDIEEQFRGAGIRPDTERSAG